MVVDINAKINVKLDKGMKIVLIKVLIALLTLSIISIPLVVSIFSIMLSTTTEIKLFLIYLSPLTFTVTYILICGIPAFFCRNHIIEGTFPRKLSHPVYLRRRIYGLCWSMVANFTIIYHLTSFIMPLRWLIFRLFGYSGNINFTFYTDTWIRDVRLLNIGEGAYLGNLVTLGTNICKINGTIMVRPINIGKGSMIGRLCIIGPGAEIGDYCDLGVRNTIGIGTQLHTKVKVGAETLILHFCVLEENVQVGDGCYIESRCKFGKNIIIPDRTYIPAKMSFENQMQLNTFLEKKIIPNKANKYDMLQMIEKH